jgi:hypothetical protein
MLSQILAPVVVAVVGTSVNPALFNLESLVTVVLES